MNNNKICIVVNCMVWRNGMEIFSIEMTKGLINGGCDIIAIVPKTIINLSEWKKLKLKKLVIIETYTNKKELLINTSKLIISNNYRKIKSKFKNIRIDAVYVPMLNLWSGIINSMFPESLKYVTLHDPVAHSGANKIRTFIDEYNAKKADKIIILTEKFRDTVKRRFGFDYRNIIHIPHGSYSKYTEYKSLNPYHYNGKMNYLFFGRIEDYKGLHVLAKAFSVVNRKYPDTSLTIAGNGDFSKYKSEYEHLPNTNLEIRWIDEQEVADFFEPENVVVVLPYLDATQSGVVSIAMNFNCPIIASGAGGLSEQIKDNVTGILFEAGNYKALAEAMVRLYENDTLRSDLVDNANDELKSLNWNSLASILIKDITKEIRFRQNQK